MMKKIIYIIIFFSSSMGFSQGEANIWYFGENAGLDFNNCSPVSIDGGQINTREGCSSFSDASGDLLFYSDGSTVWNKNHDIMTGGLAGDSSSSQSAMIIPRPLNSSQYYIFTVGAQSGGNPGFGYYTVDMNAAGGLGAVTDGPVNLSEGRSGDWSEKVAAVKGDEDGTFWVVSYVQNEFYSYKVRSQGVQSFPIKSQVDYTATDPRGYLKISPNGRKLAIAHMSDATFVLYDFDDATGKVSNEKILPLIGGVNKPYGVEFSADSNKLYVHASNDGSGDNAASHSSSLYQFDVSSSNYSSILNSLTIIDSRNLFRGALQLGPDKKIYRALSQSYNIGLPYLGIIENPEADGTDCNYQHNGISLGSNSSTQGLPPFIASLFSQIQITGEDANGDTTILNNQTINLCIGDDFEISPETIEGTNITYTWYFNRVVFSNSQNLSFTNASSIINGEYVLNVEYTDLCGNVIEREGAFKIIVHPPPTGPSEITLNNCDFDGIPDGITTFNLELSNFYFLSGEAIPPITYHYTYADADNDTGVNEIDSTIPFNNSLNSTLYAHVGSLYGCGYYVSTMNLEVSTNNLPLNYKYEIVICDDDDTIDGLHIFDLTEATNDIISQFPLEDNLSVTYYRNLLDAQSEQNQIIPQVYYLSEEPFLQNIYINIKDDDENKCFAIGQYVDLIVNPIPEFEVDSEVLLCPIISPTITLETYNPIDDYTYTWLNESGEEIGSESMITVSSGGLYNVIAISDLDCESTQTVNVIEFETQEIVREDILIVDDSENNTITINTNGNGLGNGDYQFSLDHESGPFQDQPYFEHVLPGRHVIYISASNGCGTGELEVFVLGYPTFFTPNNDGYNDEWNILGLDKNFYEFSQIRIFDRFGKVVANINSNSRGWDGFYNGKELPETDYWFSVQLIDINGIVKTRKGHFSLIRR